jgi:hypothetical protein
MLLAAQPYHWPAGPEMRVNSYTPGAQSAPSMAMDADGDFVVAWTSDGQDGHLAGVYAQRYSNAGMPQGAEFRVNTTTAFGQHTPTVAMDADGDFVVAWESFASGYYGFYYADVYAQRYNASGVPQGSEFRVGSATTSDQYAPSAAMDADGDFVIAWQASAQDGRTEIHAQRYSAAGAAQEAEFRVDTFTTGIQFGASAAMDADGDFVVAWSDGYLQGAGESIYAQRYNAAGVKQGSEFRVNTYTPSRQETASVAMDADGNFVVTWQSLYQGGSGWGVYAQRYNAAGVPQGTEFRVSSVTDGHELSPSAAMSSNGDFVISWDSGSNGGIYAQRYGAAGTPQGTVFHINTRTTQYMTSAAMDADGDFVVSWIRFSQDGSSWDVYAQRYTTFGPSSAATVGDRVWNDSNANGIQDIGELGIAGATVELFSGDGAGVASVSTNATGHYSIPVLTGASAFLHFVNPVGLLTTHQDRGANDELDSDVDRVTSRSPTFTTGAAGTANNSSDAGFSLPGTVRGVAFFDRSGDGVRNGGEEALDGFEVFLEVDGNVVSSGYTDPAGSYSFTNLLGDTYRLGVVDQAQWIEPALGSFLVAPDATSLRDVPLRTLAPDSASAPLGGELRVNSYTTEFQAYPSTAMDDAGNFVVAWYGRGSGDNFGIFAQRYNAAGVKQGTEFRVNTYTTNSQYGASVAMDADGDFVIAWQSYHQDGSYWGVYAQRYNPAGAKQGTEFRVNTYTLSAQHEPAVAMDADGDFVVAWQGWGASGYGIQAQRYSAAGVPQGGEFLVNPGTTLVGVSPTVAMDADGDFVVAWDGLTVGYYGYVYDVDVYAQRYNATGVSQAAAFRVNTNTTDYEYDPSAAMNADGDFAIAWVNTPFDSPQLYGADVHAQRYSASGVPQATEFLVNTHTTNGQFGPSAAMDDDGDLVIAWASYLQDGSGEGVYIQRYNAAGVKQGTEFGVNSYTLGPQAYVSAAMDADGDFVVTWMSWPPEDPLYGIAAQLFDVSQRPAITSSQFVWNGGPPRIEFTFDQDVSASLSSADLVLDNLTTSTTIPTAAIVKTWNAATKTVTFTFPALPNGGSLPDGDYRATLTAAGVSNATGITIATDYAVQLFVLAGDANRDRRVDVADLGILATNWQQSPRTFSQGDFNYDGTVDVGDLGILASNWQKNLGTAAPPANPTAATRAPTRSKPFRESALRGAKLPNGSDLLAALTDLA